MSTRQRTICFLILSTIFLWGCATEKHHIRDNQTLPLVSLYPFPLKGQYLLNELTIGCRKEGIAVEASMERTMVENLGFIYILNLRIKNQRPSILEVNPKEIFARRADQKDSFTTVTEEELTEKIKSQASYDYARSLKEKATYETIMHGGIVSGYGGLAFLGYILSRQKDKEVEKALSKYSQLESQIKRDLLSYTRVPREGFTEGLVLFLPKRHPFSVADDLITQIYLEGEEFLFRFVEAGKTPTIELQPEKKSVYSEKEIKEWYKAIKKWEWKKISESEHTTYCYDKINISFPSKDVVRVYTILYYESKKAINDKINQYQQLGISTKGYENLYGTISLQEINCSNKMYLPIFLMDYDKNRNILNQFWDLSKDGWTKIPSTMQTLEELYKVVCP